jgi:flagellar FliL protein
MSDAPAANGAPGKSRKGLIIIIAAVVLLGGGGAGAWFAFGGNKDEPKDAEHEPVAKLPPQFVTLEPFVVNFEPGANARFLQVAVQLMTREPMLATELEHLVPIIRNDLLLLFGDKKVDEVSTQAGKEALRAATLETVRKIINDEGGKGEALEAVYFTSFVMQ